MNSSLRATSIIVLISAAGWLFWTLSQREDPAPLVQEAAKSRMAPPGTTAVGTTPPETPPPELEPLEAVDDSSAVGSSTPETESASPTPGPQEAPRAAPGATTDSLEPLTARLPFVVLGFNREPIADTRIALLSSVDPSAGAVRTGITDRNGDAHFDDLPAGTYDYSIEAPGRPALLSSTSITVAAGYNEPIEIQLPSYDQSIFGTILDQNGKPVGGLELTAALSTTQPAPTLRARSPRTTSRADGGFVLAALCDGEYELQTLPTELYSAVTATVRAGTESVVLRVVENLDFNIFGQATDLDGRPVPGVRVTPIGHSSGPTSTDREGRYQLLIRVRESHRVHRVLFERRGFISQRIELTGDQLRHGELDIVLEPLTETIELTGRLIDERGGAVVAEVVHLHSPSLGSRYRTTSNDQGDFEFPAVSTAADYQLVVRPQKAYRDHTLTGVDLRHERPPLEVVLEPLETGVVRGRMITADGHPVPAFALELRSAQAFASTLELLSDAHGYFEQSDVPSGALRFSTRSLPRFRIHGLALDPRAEETVDLILDLGDRRLTGVVSDSSGRPVAGAKVHLSWSHRERAGEAILRSDSKRESVTDAVGRFEFAGFGPGRRRVLVEAPGFATFERDLESGSDSVEIELEELSSVRE